jgi:predicted Zn-ribbon and HTH transcriptional regulator
MQKLKSKIIQKNKCESCGYEWFPRVEKPRQCPNCKRQIKYSPQMVSDSKLKVISKK